MSLFNLITWWSGQIADNNDNFEGSSLCVSRFNSFDSSSSHVEKDTIIVGSPSGMLSIYQPTDVFYTTGNYSPTDVIMECQLDQPIIDIKCGKFAMTKTDKYSIAVLHPKRVVCYAISFADGFAEYGKQFKLNVAFEFNLSSSAFSLCKGSFGGVKTKEFFCINHLTSNNELRFFEQDGIASECVLPGERTLPSKMLYLSRVDCFAIFSLPDETLECYKYQDLITSNSAGNLTAPVWTFCVGEFVLEMATHQTTNSESVILILGEQSLICLTDGGVIKFIKKLDYTAVTFHSFVIGYYFEPDARLLITIASDMESLFIYESSSATGPINCKLIWSTQLLFVPVAIARGNFDGIPGGIVLLSETGRIMVAFFGTNPTIFVPPVLGATENVQIESVQQELNRLEEDIKQGIDFTDVSFINAATNRDLQVAVTVRPGLLPSKPFMTKNLASITEMPKMACVHVKLCPKISLEQIQIAINPPPPMAVSENCISLENVEVDKEVDCEFFIYLSVPNDPQSLSVPIILSLINRQGVPRIIERSVDLPPELIFKQCAPLKEAQFKLTLKGKSAGKDIWNLFPEFAGDAVNPQALGLQSIYSGNVVTVVLGKNSNRYRIQSDNIASLSIIMELLIKRLTKPHHPGAPQASNAHAEEISINQSYFIDQLIESIESHSAHRKAVKQVDGEIEKKSRQMRLFQRKLFLKLQQDPPHPTYHSAAKLLRLTHGDFTDLQERLLKAVDGLRESQLMLGNHMQLIKTVILHSKTLPQPIRDNLQAALINPIRDWIEMSWEETMGPAIEMLSHVGPLGKAKLGTSDIEDIKSFAQLPFDMDRFQKNLKHILNRIEAGEEMGFDNIPTESEAGVKESESSEWLDQSNPPANAIQYEEDDRVSMNDMDMV